MTPDQIALATLRAQEFQAWLTGLAIFLGPFAGVLFTLWFQARKERRDAKLQLFLALMSERKGILVSKEVARALNQVDVVYSGNPKVKALWHKYYGLLSQQPGEDRAHTWLELLAAMAEDLHYRGLSQVDLDKLYIPQGHVDDVEHQRKVGKELLRVLEASERLATIPRIGTEN